MTADQKDTITGVMITLKFQKNQNIVNEGEQASSFYIIKEGNVSVVKAGKEIRKMTKGDSFGEQALYANTVRGASVKALGDNVKCITIGRDSLTQILGDSIQVIAVRNQQKWALEKSPILRNLTKIQVEKILDAMKIVNYKAGDVIFQKGSPCHQKVIAVIDGSLKKKNSPAIVAAKGAAFGDEYLQATFKSKTYDDDIVMETDGNLSEITHSAFEKAIGGNIEEVLKKNENSHEKRMAGTASELKIAGKNVLLEELIHYKKLGAGMFGNVYLVKEKNKEQFYALKCVSKQQVVEQRLERHLQQEKSVLEVLNFPFIMQFIKTFKDQNFIYFLVEYVKGLELYEVIRIINLLNTADSQFYTGSMILAIEFLHMQGIIYRDLKPENIMIDSTGYMKMIDMGTAKFLKGKGSVINRTFTIIGTPHYMAPEIISGKGYTLNVDLWSIGICLYEFLCGMVPFGEEAEDPYEIHEEIMSMPLKYPNFLKDIKAKRLIDQLLSKVAEARLGGSFAALKAHPWFDKFDWDQLLDRQLKPPLVPPKEKLMSDDEIKKMEKLSKKVITVLEEENKNHKKYQKEKATDSNWDKNF